ncbi:hypothetical protein LC065_19515 [Halobacillus litoralis]|nr:hypothetical protein [Halobacillus litoralis]WLR47653.1 hypothetical protein LC065_19515 [Halobacillus litoralis]
MGMDQMEHEDHSNEEYHMGHAEAEQVLDDIAFYRTLIVNVIFIGKEGS